MNIRRLEDELNNTYDIIDMLRKAHKIREDEE